jgi:hypothetical protein
MAHARIVENAKGDGNCAFNAFVLGLVDPSVLNNLQPSAVAIADDGPFVAEASQALRLKAPYSWNTLKAYLLSDETPPFRLNLQEKLSPLLRQIAIGFIVAAPQQHLAMTTPPILAELDQYFIERINQEFDDISANRVGDVFIRHSFIKNKFEELHQLTSGYINAAHILLTKWWADEGHTEFLNKMAHPAMNAGDTHLYAGDLELAPLGAFFGTNIRVHSQARKIHTTIYSASNLLPLELVTHARALTDRGIATNDIPPIWTDLPLDQLTARLNVVPQFDELIAHIRTAKPMPKIGDALPPNFDMDCLAELGARGIINMSGRLAIDPTGEAFVKRLIQFPAKDLVIQKATYRPAPVVNLQNQNAAHWNNLRPAAPAAAAKLKPAGAKPSAAAGVKKSASSKLKAKTKTKTASTSSSSSSSSTTAAPYKSTSAEREVNDAVNQAFDLLNQNSPPLSDKQVEVRFDKVFNDFATVLDKFKSKKIDMSFFKQEKQRLLSEVTEEVKQAKKLHK